MNGFPRLMGRAAAALTPPLFALALALWAAGEARAQWAPSPSNGNNIYNTNAGGVGVGTNTPGNYRLHVFGVGSSVEAAIANFFGTGSNLLESQAGVKVGLLNNYYSASGGAETARGVVTLGYSNGPGSNVTGFYSRQRVWHNDAVAQGVFGIAEADATGSAGQTLFGGRFEAKTTDVGGGGGNGAYGVYAKGAVGASTNMYHSAFGVLARASAAAGTDATVSTYAVYAEGTNSGAGRAYGVYSAAGTNYFNGSVGLGTASPSYRLDVQGGQVNASGGLCMNGDCKTSWSQVTGGGEGQWTKTGTSLYYDAGSVGIGTQSPQAPLHVQRNVNGDASLYLLNSGGGANSRSILLLGEAASDARYAYLAYHGANHATRPNSTLFSAAGAGGFHIYSFGGPSSTGGLITFNTAPKGNNNLAAERMRIDHDGNVVVGATSQALGPAYKLYVGGGISATGEITGATVNATFQDVAEWVPSTQKLAAGTVVVLDAGRTNHVVASGKAYDTAVAGVVSAQPGVILGIAGEGKLMVATTGRVKVRVDATRAPVKVGDLLVTSDREGVAMKSVPVDLGGVRIHRPGTIIGKALEPLDKGVSEILVLLSLQ